MRIDGPPDPGWRLYWLIMTLGWFFLLFLGPEIYALATNPKNTLSNVIWTAERFQTGQPVWQWNTFHFLFIGMFIVADLWLIGHFGWGIWR